MKVGARPPPRVDDEGEVGQAERGDDGEGGGASFSSPFDA